MPIPAYPGVATRKGDRDTSAVQRIQSALVALGIGDGLTDGVFDAAMQSAVCLFQSRNVDTAGVPLKVDGIVGRFTWIALFGLSETDLLAPVPVLARLPAQMLAVATTQIGVREWPGQANRGAQVDQYLQAAGIANPGSNPPGGYPWCQAFLYWCAVQACHALGRPDVPVPRTAGVLRHWQLAAQVSRVRRIPKAQALADPTLVTPGMFFTLDHGASKGHTGLVESVYPDGRLVTIEGNANAEGGREGVGVYRLDRRKLTEDKLKGFVDFGAA